VSGPTLAEIKQWPATVDVEKAAEALGISRSTAYDLIRRNEFPVTVISVRTRRRVVTAGLVELLGGDHAA
jgi:excisionase family DNA binding protein